MALENKPDPLESSKISREKIFFYSKAASLLIQRAQAIYLLKGRKHWYLFLKRPQAWGRRDPADPQPRNPTDSNNLKSFKQERGGAIPPTEIHVNESFVL